MVVERANCCGGSGVEARATFLVPRDQPSSRLLRVSGNDALSESGGKQYHAVTLVVDHLACVGVKVVVVK